MHDNTPLSANERALAISVLIVGGLVAAFAAVTVASSAYSVTTGKVFGGDFSKSMSKLGGKNDKAMGEMVEHQLAAQAEATARYAPYQLMTELAYLAVIAAVLVAAFRALSDGAWRKRLGQLAASVALVRIGVGIVTYLFTQAIMTATSESMMKAIADRPGGSAEKTDELMRITRGAMAGMTIATSACTTFIICGYFGVVAFVFLSQRKPAAPR